MAKRTYTPAEKQAALDLYREHGPTATGQQLGIPKQTVQKWAMEAGVRTVHVENMRAAHEVMRLKWEERRLDLTHEYGRLCAKALDKCEEMLDDDSTGKAKDAATIAAIFTDKAQLLSGGATSRHETIGAIEAELHDLAVELGIPADKLNA